MPTKALTTVKAAGVPAKRGFDANIRVLKANASQGEVVRSQGWEYEDEFEQMYGVRDGTKPEILLPPFQPKVLEALCQQNNTLSTCVEAMVVNVHGTGFNIVAYDQDDKDDPRLDELYAFFGEVFPGVSFLTLRKQVGRDREKSGNGYIEFIRNGEDQLIFLKRMEPKITRLCKQDEPKTVPISVTRNGETFTVHYGQRFRRFVQCIGEKKFRYFKPVGCPLHLNAETGLWDETTPFEKRASEVLWLPRDEDSISPYGVPTWLPQLPSVMGSRKAEEHNLEFFDKGGVPPIMVFVHGGQLTEEAADTLRQHLQGGGRNKHTIPVIETLSTGGSIDSGSGVKVTVERFGAERQNDSMFEKYDASCEARVRSSWRLPQLFVGRVDGLAFATAFASYTVTEGAVFAPERGWFDEIVNRYIMPELDPDGMFKFRSRPLTIRDVDQQLKALGIAVESGVLGREQLVEVLSEVSSLALRLDDDDIVQVGSGTSLGNVIDPKDVLTPTGVGTSMSTPAKKLRTVSKSADPAITAMAERAASLFFDAAEPAQLLSLMQEVVTLPKAEAAEFRTALTQAVMGGGQDGEFSKLACTTIFALMAAPHGAA